MTILQRAATVSADLESSTRSREFVSIAKYFAASHGRSGAAAALAEESRASARVVECLRSNVVTVRRSAVAAGGTGATDWGAQLAEYDSAIAGFVDSLRHVGVFDRMLPSTTRVGLRQRVVAVTTGAVGGVAGKSSPKVISSLTLANQQIDEIVAAATLVVSEEVARSTAPEAFQLFARELRGAVSAVTDSAFLPILVVGAPSFASSGNDADAVRANIRVLLTAVVTGSQSSLFLVTTPTICKALAVISDPGGSSAFPSMAWSGGTIAGINVVASDSATSGTMTLIDASAVAAASGDIRLDRSMQADVALNDAPDSPPISTAALTSLWSHNLIGIKCERTFGAELLRTNAAAVITGVNIEGNSPA